MIRLSDNQTELLPALHRGDMPRFNARQSAMIRQYERLRTEWEQQLDLLECPERKNHSQLLAKAEWLDRQLAMMEWKLPDTYTSAFFIACAVSSPLKKGADPLELAGEGQTPFSTGC